MALPATPQVNVLLQDSKDSDIVLLNAKTNQAEAVCQSGGQVDWGPNKNLVTALKRMVGSCTAGALSAPKAFASSIIARTPATLFSDTGEGLQIGVLCACRDLVADVLT